MLGQPNGRRTKIFLEWLLRIYQRRGFRWLIVIWDNASFHKSLRKWAWEGPCRAHKEGKIKILLLPLPKRSPWLNPPEPRWMHCKKRVYDAQEAPTISEVKERVYGYFFPDKKST
ncbi:MAG: transposase [bacterium]